MFQYSWGIKKILKALSQILQHLNQLIRNTELEGSESARVYASPTPCQLGLSASISTNIPSHKVLQEESRVTAGDAWWRRVSRWPKADGSTSDFVIIKRAWDTLLLC